MGVYRNNLDNPFKGLYQNMPSFYKMEIHFNLLHSMKNAYYVLADHIKMPLSDSPMASSRPGLEKYQEPGSQWAQEFVAGAFFFFFALCSINSCEASYCGGTIVSWLYKSSIFGPFCSERPVSFQGSQG